jgi:ankyrin repeat protein
MNTWMTKNKIFLIGTVALILLMPLLSSAKDLSQELAYSIMECSNERLSASEFVTQHDHIRALLAQGASPDAIEKSTGKPAILWTISNADLESLKMLVDKGGNLDVENKGRDALTEAVDDVCSLKPASQSFEIFVYVSQKSTLVQKFGPKALMAAAGQCREDDIGLKVFSILLKSGVDPNASVPPINKKYFSPLVAAVKANRPRFVKLLLENKADVNAGESGVTPLSMAKHFGNTAIADVLIKAGAVK